MIQRIKIDSREYELGHGDCGLTISKILSIGIDTNTKYLLANDRLFAELVIEQRERKAVTRAQEVFDKRYGKFLGYEFLFVDNLPNNLVVGLDDNFNKTVEIECL